MSIVCVHGVPDTSAMWWPLARALKTGPIDPLFLSLPGFEKPAPERFSCTKDAYAKWVVEEIEEVVRISGAPVDLIGHDWGALLVLRAASLRPDLVRSFVVANALIDSQYSGHTMAKLWATPLVGELVMAVSATRDFESGLVKAGMPADLAAEESKYWTRRMRQSILSLYRSARGLSFRGEWEEDLANLPEHGLILWGETDPFVDLSVARRFSKRWDYPLHVLEGLGHWGIVERPEEAAEHIREFWNSIPVAQQ